MTRRMALLVMLLSACQGTPLRTPPPLPEPPVKIVVQAALSTPSGLQAIPEGSLLHSGDMLAFQIQASKDVMVFVVQEAIGHKMSMLVPSGNQTPVLVRANQDSRVPDAQSWIHPEESPGEQALYVVASRFPIPESQILTTVARREGTQRRDPPPIIKDKERGKQRAVEAVPPLVGTLGGDDLAIIPFRYYYE